VVIQGWGCSQKKPEALAWLDRATTLGKGVWVTRFYPLLPPALPKYYTPPYNCLTEEAIKLAYNFCIPA